MQADRSGKVLIDKLRNTIKVCRHVSVSCWYPSHGFCQSAVCVCLQEFELTIDLDTLLSDMDKEQSGSIDFKEFKSLLD